TQTLGSPIREFSRSPLEGTPSSTIGENPDLSSEVQNLKEKRDEHSKQLEQSVEKLGQLQSENNEKYPGIISSSLQAGPRPSGPIRERSRSPLEGTPSSVPGTELPSKKWKTSDKENLPYFRIWKSLT
ncbi:hypothetical protein HID58_067477, partial [Brassica napus]